MRCFLSYSYQTDISVIKHILTESNISYVNPIENLEYGNAIVQTISRQIKDSDFIIAVLDKSTNVSFEIGLAVGSKKPIFLIINDKDEQPTFLSAVTYTISSPSDYEKIKFSFDIFLNNLPIKKGKTPSNATEIIKSNKRYNGEKLSKDYVNSLKDLGNIRGQDFENFVGDLFKQLNINIFAQNRTKDRDFQADFSLWIDELDSVIGNPIIVETKSNAEKLSINNGIQQLSFYLSKYNSKVGLLIYNNPTGRITNDVYSVFPLVISISIQELLSELTEKSLSQIILQLRNKAVHKEIF